MESRIRLEVSSYLTATRVMSCRNMDCRFKNRLEPFDCCFKTLELGDTGQCLRYLPKEK
jgi:hypothetical protein